jgi:pimeloyl-ACP methyl ester carboxylesterase
MQQPEPSLIATQYGALEYAWFGDGPTVLALHGAAGGYDQGLLLARTIGGPGFRFVAMSRPGYLGTPLTAGPTPDAQADAAAALLDALGIRKAAVMAISGGGPCALELALRHPQRCWALVLVSTCSAPVTTRLPLLYYALPLIARSATLLRLLRARRARDLDRGRCRGITDAALSARTLQDPEVGPLVRELTLGQFDRFAKRLAGTVNDVAQTRRFPGLPLERIGAPTLIVHGTRDPLVPIAQAKTLVSRIPGAELLALEEAEHMAVFTHRDEVRRRVTGFLARHALRAA